MEKTDYDNLSNVELDVLTKKILMDNIKQKNVDEVMMKFDRSMKIRICQQQQRLQTDHEGPSTYCHRMRKALESKEDIRELIVSLRVTLGGQNFTWIDEFGQEGGFRLLVSLLSKLLQKIGRLKNENEHYVQVEEDLVFSLYELLKSTRVCLNCEPGVRFLLQSDSKLCSKLIEALYIAIELKSDRSERSNNYNQLIIIILTLLAAISFLGKDGNGEFDITGNSLLICNLTSVAEKKNMSSRFACIVRCLHFREQEITYKALVFINTLLSCIDDNDWHVRMLWRNELMLAGLKPLLPNIKRIAEKNENIKRAYASFENELKADYEEFLNRFENLKGNVTDLKDCANMLITSCRNTDSEMSLQKIFLHLLLINDRKYKRDTYFKMFLMCISEIAFSNMGSGPDYGKQIAINIQIDDALQKIESQSQHDRINKLLESAIEAKQEAVSLQLQYYKKIEEYQEECTILRKHIQDNGQPLPSKTVFDLPKPAEISTSGVIKTHNAMGTSDTTVSLPPPPPPPPPPSLLGPARGKTTKGNSAPPPPPPPLPPQLLKKSDPLPPPNLQRTTGFNFVSASDEIPDYLKKKNNKVANVPMKKIPWNAAIIKPNIINPDSLWAKVDDTEIASEDVFEYLKTKYSAINKGTTVTIDATKKQSRKKIPVVIQDQKMLQALAILQGSCKLTFKEWKTSLMEIDEKTLNAGIVNQLKNALPPIEMINKLRDFSEEDIQNMPEGEQFVATLSTINSLPIRLEAIQLSLSWNDLFTELKSGITIITEACEEVIKSDGLKQFINLVLVAGNFMSRTKNSKDTFAFELGVLNRLIDTKDTENNETLLHGLIFLFHKKLDGKYSNFPIEDFHHVTKACRIDMADLDKSKNQLNSSVKKITSHITTYKVQCENDQFLVKINAFIEQAKKDLFIVDGLWENMQLKWKSLQRYLCIEPKKYPLEKLFIDLNVFKNNYQNIWMQVSKLFNKNDAETIKNPKKKGENRRRPLHQIQPIMAKEAAKLAKEKSRQQTTDNSASTGGVLDKIEQMLEEGKYRPDGLHRPGYRVRRKGQPTIYKFLDPRDEDFSSQSQQIPTAVELLQRLRGLEH